MTHVCIDKVLRVITSSHPVMTQFLCLYSMPMIPQFKSYVASEGSCNKQGHTLDLEQIWQLLIGRMKSQTSM